VIIHPDTEMVISMSGGKDSSAMLALLCEQYPDIKKHVVWADTGFEYPGQKEWCEKIANQFGLEVHRVTSKWDFFSIARNRKMWPSPDCRKCTSTLKLEPIEKWVKNNVKSKNIIMCSGLRAEESARRAKLPQVEIDTRITNSKRTVHDFYPLLHWSERQVKNFLQNSGIPLHDCYDYLSRLSCMVCIYNRKKELQAIKSNNREAFDKICEMEREINFTFKPGYTLEQYIISQFDNQVEFDFSRGGGE